MLLEEKRALRGVMMARRQQVPPEERARLSAAAAARLATLPEMVTVGAAHGMVAGYLAIAGRGEIDPAPALAAARARGARLAFPRVSATPPRLRFHRVDDPEDAAALAPGPFSLLEPHAASPEVEVEDLDLVILPGLAFDRRGRRLGYGGGFYDEAAGRMRKVGRGLLVGFAYEFQVVDQCPAGPDDVDVDCVVTDREVVRCRGGSA